MSDQHIQPSLHVITASHISAHLVVLLVGSLKVDEIRDVVCEEEDEIFSTLVWLDGAD